MACRAGLLGLGPNLANTLLDLSETGIRLIAREPLKRGQQVEVNLQPPHNFAPVTRAAIVIWAIRTLEGTYCAGLQFQRRLPYAVLQQFTDPGQLGTHPPAP